MIDKRLLQEIKIWGQKVDKWLRIKDYSEVQAYIHPSGRYGEPPILEIELETIKFNRFIGIEVFELENENKNKLYIAADIREIKGYGVGHFNLLYEQLPNCQFKDEDFSFQMGDDPEKKLG